MPPKTEASLDLSEFYDRRKQKKRSKARSCNVGVALSSLAEGDRAVFNAALGSGEFDYEILSGWLDDHAGSAWVGAWQSVRTHHQRKCSCHG